MQRGLGRLLLEKCYHFCESMQTRTASVVIELPENLHNLLTQYTDTSKVDFNHFVTFAVAYVLMMSAVEGISDTPILAEIYRKYILNNGRIDSFYTE